MITEILRAELGKYKVGSGEANPRYFTESAERVFKNYMFAPSRRKYVEGKDTQHKFDCIFCSIIKGEKGVIKKVLYRDKNVMVVVNPFPYTVGHIQVVPLRHVVYPSELTQGERTNFFEVVSRAIELVKKTYNPDGVNVGLNIGDAAGGSIRHLHVHILPRWARGVGFMEATASTRVLSEDIGTTMKRYKKNLRILKMGT
jgi:diadenosine tetraphosphate (Ap4A) HIT family hydrolase